MELLAAHIWLILLLKTAFPFMNHDDASIHSVKSLASSSTNTHLPLTFKLLGYCAEASNSVEQ